ncbi:RDD family protein [Brachybacterium endophyticum]|uniref:RDD family protein n=1 Tax=Brachybacterium endophyticum TaxID=2182385 RepID=A0A2U2RH51_9MICO|nr:RDD family protein [Brachybacterium endophyticum]PWH05151.1 RDD family protein [Brachybacterium endophyticum]
MTPASSTTDALVTGEAVHLDLRPASFATRLLSYLVDGAIMLSLSLGMTVGIYAASTSTGLDAGFLQAGLVLASVLTFLGYPVLLEMLTDGRSVGRLATGTRVVREDGGPVHVRQSLLRAVMAMLEIWSTSGALALVTSLVDRRSRRIGDLLAGTMVIQERMRAPRPVREQMPSELSSWAAGADVGRLPLPLLQDIRAFLPRAGSLNPESRRRIARDLLQRTMPSVTPAPPPGTDPELFLRAVLAERSRRDEEHLRRRTAREQELALDVRTVPFSA